VGRNHSFLVEIWMVTLQLAWAETVLCAGIESPSVTEQSSRKDNVWAHTKIPLLGLLYIIRMTLSLVVIEFSCTGKHSCMCLWRWTYGPEECVMLIVLIIKYVARPL
jgi:uncharacterized membrane protein